MMNYNLVNTLRYLLRFYEMILRPLIQFPASSAIVVFVFLSLLVGAFFSSSFFVYFSTVQSSMQQTVLTVTNSTITEIPKKPHRKIEIPLKCSDDNITQTCPASDPEKQEMDPDAGPPSTCPEYFRWIYEDLQPWEKNGITRNMMEGAKRTANFRVAISNGKTYVERYREYWQKSRDVFTLWGILQLLRRYPGRVPDLELMFDCSDYPEIRKGHRWPFAAPPSLLLGYCGNDKRWDIVFPDWYFWGWPDINIRPWENLSKDLKEGNKRVKLADREPYAYWKGNPNVASHRMDLLKCNVSDKQDWNARFSLSLFFPELVFYHASVG